MKVLITTTILIDYHKSPSKKNTVRSYKVFNEGNKERCVPLLSPVLEALDPLGNIGPVFVQMHKTRF